MDSMDSDVPDLATQLCLRSCEIFGLTCPRQPVTKAENEAPGAKPSREANSQLLYEVLPWSYLFLKPIICFQS